MQALDPADGTHPGAPGRFTSRPVRLGAALVLVALGLGAVVSRATSFSADIVAHNDLTQDYVATRAWSDGLDPYAPTAGLVDRYLGDDAASYRIQYEDRRNPHPPIEIVMVRPFGSLGYRGARLAWLALMSLLLAASTVLVLREMGTSLRGAIAGGVAILALPVVQQDLIWAQINGVILFLVVVAWRALRRGRDARTGMALGLATALKFYPLIFILPLLRARRFGAAAWQIGTALVVSLAAVVVVGPDATQTYLRVAAPENLEYWRAAPMNLSLVSAPFRWLTRSVWRQPSIELSIVPELLAIAVLAACVYGAVRTPARASGDQFWAVAPWMLLATPLAWSFTLSLALPYLVVLVLAGIRARGLPHPSILIPTVILIATPLPGLPVPGPGNSLLTILLGFGIPTYALLWVGIAEWKRIRDDASERTPAQ